MISDGIKLKTRWSIMKARSQEEADRGEYYEISIVDGNLALNEGIQELLDILCGIGGTAFSNANAYIGVGNSNTAASAAQTGLQGASKTYKAMSASYPQRSSQTMTWRAQFGSSDANYAWEEFTVANGNSDSAKNLNRKVSSQGTKTAGQVWTLDVTITPS